MGCERPTVIIVSARYDVRDERLVEGGCVPGAHWIDVARAAALEIFGRFSALEFSEGMGQLVGEVTRGVTNDVRSFMVAWDGSKEGWGPSELGDVARAYFVQWLRDQAYEDGSSPLWWCEVQYGGDDRVARVLAHGNDGGYPETDREPPVLSMEEGAEQDTSWRSLGRRF